MEWNEVPNFVRGLRKWGNVPQSAVYVIDFYCSNQVCGVKLFDFDCSGEEGWFKYVIGFDPNFRGNSFRKIDDPRWFSYSAGSRNNLVVGGVVVECPQCFEKYWFHITLGSYEVGKRHCKKWPKETG